MPSLDLERLEQARGMAAGLTDAELARELRGDRTSLLPEAWRALEEEARRRSTPRTSPILATTPTLNRPIRRVIGIVGSQTVLGASFVQDWPYSLPEARASLLNDLSANAAHLGADAVVGIAFTISQGNSMLVMLASGTAVELSSQA